MVPKGVNWFLLFVANSILMAHTVVCVKKECFQKKKKYAKLLKVFYSLTVNCVLSEILISLILKDFHLVSLTSYSRIRKFCDTLPLCEYSVV